MSEKIYGEIHKMNVYHYDNTAKFSDLIGATLKSIVIDKEEWEVTFTTTDGDVFLMFHSQDCCENVRIEDICGELTDLLFSPILQAEENSSDDNTPGVTPPVEPGDGSFTWTFYRIATIKGQVVFRWLGESNGYYSESVDFHKKPKPAIMSTPDNEPSKLPIAPLIKPDITEGVIPLPPTSLLGEAERKRLDELANSGQTPPTEADKSEELTTFSDGSILKFLPRPGYPPQCVLVEATGKQIAITKDENIADWLCNSVNVVALATLKNTAEGQPLQIVSKPIILPGPGAN